MNTLRHPDRSTALAFKTAVVAKSRALVDGMLRVKLDQAAACRKLRRPHLEGEVQRPGPPLR